MHPPPLTPISICCSSETSLTQASHEASSWSCLLVSEKLRQSRGGTTRRRIGFPDCWCGGSNRAKIRYMKAADLGFIGIRGSVVALNRANGAQVWATHLNGSDFVNIVVQNETVFASCYGEIFCLDSRTGRGRWQNSLKGFGAGLATIATEGNWGTGNAPVIAEKRRRDEQAAAAAATAATM